MRSKKVFYNVITNLLLQLITIVYGFIIPKIIINNFGSTVNGLVSSITQFLAYISLMESGFGPVVKSCLYKPIANKDKNMIENILSASERFFKKLSILFILYIIILCIVYPMLVNTSFDKLFSISLILVISISTFAEYFFGMTYKLYLQAEQKNYVISLIQISTYILNIILIIIIVKIYPNIIFIKLIGSLLFVARPIFQNIYVKRKYKFSFNNVDPNFSIKNKWEGLAQHIAAVIYGNTDVTIITIFCSLAEVSVYSVYYLVVKGVKQLISAFNTGIDSSFGDMIAKNEFDILNDRFKKYELLYYSIVVIIFMCTMILIVPFISVYTLNITDANYIRYGFAILLVISELIWAIRLPYSSITLAAGHFRETRTGAIIEALLNLFISILLVFKYGLIGVTIGTIISMSIRTIEFVLHTNKYILKRSNIISFKHFIVIIIQILLIYFSCNSVIKIMFDSYWLWGLCALKVFIVSTCITFIIDFIFYNKEIRLLFNDIKKRRI